MRLAPRFFCSLIFIMSRNISIASEFSKCEPKDHQHICIDEFNKMTDVEKHKEINSALSDYSKTALFDMLFLFFKYKDSKEPQKEDFLSEEYKRYIDCVENIKSKSYFYYKFSRTLIYVSSEIAKTEPGRPINMLIHNTVDAYCKKPTA